MAATIVCNSCKRSFENDAKRAGRTTKCWCGEAIAFPARDEFGNLIRNSDGEDADAPAAPRERSGSNGVRSFVCGCIAIAFGVGFTLFSHKFAAHTGGIYYIVWGPVVGGVISCSRGMAQMATGD